MGLMAGAHDSDLGWILGKFLWDHALHASRGAAGNKEDGWSDGRTFQVSEIIYNLPRLISIYWGWLMITYGCYIDNMY